MLYWSNTNYNVIYILIYLLIRENIPIFTKSTKTLPITIKYDFIIIVLKLKKKKKHYKYGDLHNLLG